MKRQGKAWFAAGVLALTAAACFDDPTSSLRNGPTAIRLSQNTVIVRAGDSIAVQATVVDDQGNPQVVGTVSWTSADPTIAVSTEDSVRRAPGDIFTRAFIRGITNQAGITTVTLSAQGLQSTFRVVVLPATFPGLVSVTGTPGADTVTINRPAPALPLVVTYNAGDTVQFAATATVTFSATTSAVNCGPFGAYLVSRTTTLVKAVCRQPFAGRPTITNLTYAGDAETGPIAITSLNATDSVQVQRGRFRGTTVVTNDPNFGASTIITITAPGNIAFNTTSSGVFVGDSAAIVLTRTATTIVAISPRTTTGSIKVTGATLGTTVFDSLRATVQSTVNASLFPGTITTANTVGNLLDTIYVNAGGGATFTAASSVVTIGGAPTFIVGARTTTLLKVLAGRGVTGPISITNVVVAGVTIPSLQTTAYTVTSVSTGEAGEPANDNPGGTVVTLGTVAAPLIRYGAVSGHPPGAGADADDFFTFTLAAAATVVIRVDMQGNGSAGGESNPDLDVFLLNAAATTFLGASAGVSPSETFTMTALAAGTYHIYVNAYDTGDANVTYRLTVSRNP